MKRTIYFNDTRPTETQLNNTETSKIDAMIERFQSSASFGIANGFIISPNIGDPTKIDISAGTAYTGGKLKTSETNTGSAGERIYSASATTAISIDNTLNIANYIVLVYTETPATPLAERTYPFTSHYTIISDSFSIEIATAAEWTAHLAVL